MVRALLDGSKTQTRRVVKWLDLKPGINLQFSGLTASQVAGAWVLESPTRSSHEWRCAQTPCPYGVPGDRLWVRETLSPTRNAAGYIEDWHYAADGAKVPRMPGLNPEFSDAMAFAHLARPSAVPSIHMPRWASRITLEVTGVRVERLQDISEDDAISEGIAKTPAGFWSTYGQSETDGTYSPVTSYRCLWNSINGADAWDANPWVWCVSFKRFP
ncbi:hypothetical protein [Paraburkholderia sp. Ac-20342]|uniref:hypothetical protein n=1 Tax=Paraburkholderia sp. Ac-20342 TaxID=2703889 RepID=UPI001F11E3EC|nr:hypothetical protein [Paraburkholderia sp. Ac-20342]